MQLVEQGRTVVAAARDASKAQEVFKELGLSEGLNKGSGQVQPDPFTQPQLCCTAAIDPSPATISRNRLVQAHLGLWLSRLSYVVPDLSC